MFVYLHALKQELYPLNLSEIFFFLRKLLLLSLSCWHFAALQVVGDCLQL